MKWICRLFKRHWWWGPKLIPPSGPGYFMRECDVCGRIEYSHDCLSTWTTEYRDLADIANIAVSGGGGADVH